MEPETLIELIEQTLSVLMLLCWLGFAWLALKDLTAEAELGSSIREAVVDFIGSTGSTVVFLLSLSILDWNGRDRRSIVAGLIVVGFVIYLVGFAALCLLEFIWKAG